MARRILAPTVLLVVCAVVYCVPASAHHRQQTKPHSALVSTRFSAGSQPIAYEAAHFTACPDDPGGAFYNVRVKLVSCGRGEAILHHNGRGYGFHCHTGFPAHTVGPARAARAARRLRYCGKNPAAVSGSIFDGPATS